MAGPSPCNAVLPNHILGSHTLHIPSHVRDASFCFQKGCFQFLFYIASLQIQTQAPLDNPDWNGVVEIQNHNMGVSDLLIAVSLYHEPAARLTHWTGGKGHRTEVVAWTYCTG